MIGATFNLHVSLCRSFEIRAKSTSANSDSELSRFTMTKRERWGFNSAIYLAFYPFPYIFEIGLRAIK